MIDRETLQAEARRVGFELMGVAPVSPTGGGWFAPHAERLRAWLARGDHAGMAWIAERAAERQVPGRVLPGVRSALVLWLPHRTPAPPRPEGAVGRVAAYGWGRDYHNVARKGLRKLRKMLLARHPGLGTYLSVDTGPVLERAFGDRAAVGWIGRSTMLIHPRLGTFGSLAVLFVDVDLPTADEAHPDRCGTCTACLVACPTGALSADGLDARKCISYWTIEHRGVIPRALRPALGDWVFGCDICQDVCPWNHDAPTADPARWQPRPERAWPDLIAWIEADSAAVDAALLGSPMQRAGGASLRRNALIAAANLGVLAALPATWRVLRSDPDPTLRATAAWAAQVLGDADAAVIAAADPDPRVVAEAAPIASRDGLE